VQIWKCADGIVIAGSSFQFLRRTRDELMEFNLHIGHLHICTSLIFVPDETLHSPQYHYAFEFALRLRGDRICV
jgi:hypothetical protein